MHVRAPVDALDEVEMRVLSRGVLELFR